MERLKGKNVLITGASSGIGQAIAMRFAREGANVAINYRSGAEQAEATQVLAKAARPNGGGREIIVQADVSNEEQVKAMFAKTIEAFGRLDVLVNNAGIQKPGASHEIETADFDRVLSVNLRGPFLCSREAIRHFLSRPGGGVILNNSSVHEIIPKPKYLPYSVSKGGMENLTKSLALEYAGRGHSRECRGPGRGRHADQQGVDRQPEGARRSGEPHPDGPRGGSRRDRVGLRVPRVRRSIVRHGADDLRVRRADAVSRIPRGVVVGRVRRLP